MFWCQLLPKWEQTIRRCIGVALQKAWARTIKEMAVSVWNPKFYKNMSEEFVAALWGHRFRDATFSYTDWMRPGMKWLWNLCELTYRIDLQIKIHPMHTTETSSMMERQVGRTQQQARCVEAELWICICGHPINAHTCSDPVINSQSTACCNQGYSGLQPVFVLCRFLGIQGYVCFSQSRPERMGWVGSTGDPAGHSREHAGRGRCQHTHLTPATDDASSDGWVLQVELHEKWLKSTEEWRGALRAFWEHSLAKPTAPQLPQRVMTYKSEHACINSIRNQLSVVAAKLGLMGRRWFGQSCSFGSRLTWRKAVSSLVKRSGRRDNKGKSEYALLIHSQNQGNNPNCCSDQSTSQTWHHCWKAGRSGLFPASIGPRGWRDAVLWCCCIDACTRPDSFGSYPSLPHGKEVSLCPHVLLHEQNQTFMQASCVCAQEPLWHRLFSTEN